MHTQLPVAADPRCGILCGCQSHSSSCQSWPLRQLPNPCLFPNPPVAKSRGSCEIRCSCQSQGQLPNLGPVAEAEFFRRRRRRLCFLDMFLIILYHRYLWIFLIYSLYIPYIFPSYVPYIFLCVFLNLRGQE